MYTNTANRLERYGINLRDVRAALGLRVREMGLGFWVLGFIGFRELMVLCLRFWFREFRGLGLGLWFRESRVWG